MNNTLTDADIAELREFMLQLADAAATVTLQHYRGDLQVDNKLPAGQFDPATEADRQAEMALRQLIEKHYPDHSIIGEEYGVSDKGGPCQWVLDPIDGTRSYISGVPTWGTLIALCYRGQPLLGLIDQPYLGERYLGFPGGATLNGSAIATRTCTELSRATVSTTDPGLFQGRESRLWTELSARARLLRYGLDCYAYALLASGFIDVVAESGLKLHDIMALVPVIRGAGGLALDWHFEEPGPAGSLLALGDPALVDETRALFKQVLA